MKLVRVQQAEPIMNIFFISDTHFGHEACYTKFTLADGVTKLRPFSCAEEGDGAMISNWNKVVRPSDTVYHLGDVSWHTRHLENLNRMHGKKILIKGNHDTEKLHTYAKYFVDIKGTHEFEGMILSHVPIHPDSVTRFGINVHGHLHSYRVQKDGKEDPRYHCVSVEQINYTPISLEEVRKNART